MFELTLPSQHSFYSEIALSNSGETIAVCNPTTLQLWHAGEWTIIESGVEFAFGNCPLAISAEHSLRAYYSELDGESNVIVHSLTTSTVCREIPINRLGDTLLFAPDKPWLAIGVSYDNIYLIDLDTMSCTTN